MASQNELNDLRSKFGGRVPVDALATSRDLIYQVLEKFEVSNNNIEFVLPYFALFESADGSSISGTLDLDAIIINVTRSWGENKDSKLLFAIRLFLPSINGLQYVDVVAKRLGFANNDTQDFLSSIPIDTYIENAEIIDSNLLHIQYIQAVYNIITGAYPTTEEQALTLGSYHFLLKFGEFKPGVHIRGFLDNRIIEFIPTRLLKKGKKSLLDWESDLLANVKSIFDEHENEEDLDEIDRSLQWQLKYLLIVYRMPLYGCSFFRCNQRATRYTPENPVLGVHHLGIVILDKQRNIHKKYHMAEISEWGYKPDIMFNFQVKSSGELEAFIEFSFGDGKSISDLLTDYAMAYLKERDGEDLRSRSTSTTPVKNGKFSQDGGKSGATGKPLSKSKAAIKIQSLFRGFFIRLMSWRHNAARNIQRVFRGYITRIKVGDMIAELMMTGDIVVGE